MLRTTFLLFLRYWFPLLIYAVLILALSSRPQIDLPQLHISDKLIHFVEYGILGMLLFRLFKRDFKMRGLRLWLLHIFSLAAFAFLDELLQSFIPSRDADFFDWLADMSGGLAGALIYVYIRLAWKMMRTL